VSQPLRIAINGRDPTVEQLAFAALVNYGHFTAMQVRDARVRGLDLHLRRLAAATDELFRVGLDRELVCDRIRHALGPTRDASVRVVVFLPDGDEAPSVMVAVRPPLDAPTAPQRLQSVAYERPVAHIKHVGTFGQIHFGRLAERSGFDDALLTDAGGVVAEGAITNVGFFDGAGVVWPDAPALPGITMQLIAPRLAGAGLPSRRARVRLADLPFFRGAFVTNSLGIAPVGRVDDLDLSLDGERMRTLREVYESVPWDPI